MKMVNIYAAESSLSIVTMVIKSSLRIAKFNAALITTYYILPSNFFLQYLKMMNNFDSFSSRPQEAEQQE